VSHVTNRLRQGFILLLGCAGCTAGHGNVQLDSRRDSLERPEALQSLLAPVAGVLKPCGVLLCPSCWCCKGCCLHNYSGLMREHPAIGRLAHQLLHSHAYMQ